MSYNYQILFRSRSTANTGRKKYFALFLFILIALLPTLNADFWWVDDESLIRWIEPKIGHGWTGLWAYFGLWGYHYDYYPVRDLSLHMDLVLSKAFSVSLPLVSRAHQFIIFLELSLGVYILLRKFAQKVCGGTEERLLFICFALWVSSPVHLEMLTWVSARKDILALTWTIWAFVFLVWDYLIVFLIFFLLGLLSKSSLTLAPLSAFLLAWSFQISLSPKKKLVLILSAVSGVAWSLLQSIQYSQINDMRMSIDWAERLRSVVTAFGKSLAALFYSSANILEFENWGEWAALNKSYFMLGVLVLGIILLSSVYNLVRYKNFLWFVRVFACFILLLPSLGLLFPSRNFFSVRFYQPFYLLIPFGVYFFAIRKKMLSWILSGLVTLNLAAFYIQAEDFESGLNVSEKAFRSSTSNMSSAFAYLINLKNIENWGSSTSQQIQKRLSLEEVLKRNCLESLEISNSGLCYTYWREIISSDLVQSNPVLISRVLHFRAIHSMKSKEELSLENAILFSRKNHFNLNEDIDISYCNRYEFICGTERFREAFLKFLCVHQKNDLVEKYLQLWSEKLIIQPLEQKLFCQSRSF